MEALGQLHLQVFDNLYGYLTEFVSEFADADGALKLTWWQQKTAPRLRV